jgi:hypothetical protein
MDIKRDVVHREGFARAWGSEETGCAGENLRKISNFEQGHDWIVAEVL